MATSKTLPQSRKRIPRRKAETVDKNFIGLTDKVFAVLEAFSHEEFPRRVENRAPHRLAVAFLSFFDAHVIPRRGSDPRQTLTLC